MEELAEFSWEDFLEEEALESTLETYLDKVTENMTNLDTRETETKEEQEKNTEETTKRILVVDEKALEKMYSYVERNYGKTYLTEGEEKENQCSCVSGYTQRLQPLFYKRNFKRAGDAELSVRVCQKTKKQEPL